MPLSDDIIKGIKSRLLISYPFFGSVLSDLRLVPSTDEERISIQDERITYNPCFVENSRPAEVAYWLCREILHLTMDHGNRRRMRSTTLWSAATEYCVNSILDKEGLASGIQVKFFRRGFSGKSADQIYAILADEARRNGIMGEIDRIDELLSDSHGETGEEYEAAMRRISLVMHARPDDIDGIMRESLTRRKGQGLYRSRTLEIISKARLAERTLGRRGFQVDLPIYAAGGSTVPWEEVLASYISNDRAGVSYRRFRRKYVSDGIFLPQRYSETLKLVVAVDVSASIPETTLDSFYSEILRIIRTWDPDSRVRLIQLDAEIQSDMEAGASSPVETILRRRGFGGTDFRPLFRRLESDGNLDPVVVFTDGRGIMPDEEPQSYPVLWITTDLHAPWGISLEYEVEL